MQRSLAMLALAALSFAGVSVLRRQHRQRLAARPKAKPEALQTWEGEGGGLPNGGPGPAIRSVASTGDTPSATTTTDTATQDAKKV
jgi:hypothetical protein